MPVIPRLEQSVGISDPSASRATGLGVESFGGGLAQGLNSFNAELETVALKAKETADAGAVLGGMKQADDLEIAKVSEVKNLKGNLAGIPDKFVQDWDKETDKIRGGLYNDTQKAAFDRLMVTRRHSFASTVTDHANRETERYAIGNAKSAVDSAQQKVALYYDDPIKFEDARKELELRAKTFAKMQGFDTESEAGREVIFKVNSLAYEDQIQARIERNATEAKGMFDVYRAQGKLDKDAVERLDKVLQPAVSFQVGLETATRLFETSGNIADAMKSLRTELKNDPKALKNGESELKGMFAEKRAAQDQMADQAEAEILRISTDKQMRGGTPQVSDIPQKLWTKLTLADPKRADAIQDEMRREREHQIDRAESRADREESRAARRQTKETLDQMQNWSNMVQDPASLKGANLDRMLVSGVINKESYKDLSRRKAELINSPEKESGIKTKSGLVEDILGASGVKPKTEQHVKAISYIENRLAGIKDPTHADIEKATREAVYKVPRSWAVDKPVYNMTIKDVPDSERKAIQQAFKQRGKAPTESQILTVYIRKSTQGQ